MEALTLIGILILCLFVNIPIAFSLGIAALVTIATFDVLPLGFVIQAFFSSGDSFPLLAVPFFILAGDIMMQGGISTRLVEFARTMIGHRRGGLGFVTIATCAIFASISGSGPATVAAIGGILIPAMIEEGYDRGFSSSLAASAGTLGPIIPPSITMVMYGVIAQQSITKLFMAGFIPGVLMAVVLIAYVKYIAEKKSYGIIREKASTKERLKSLSDAKWSLLVPVIILGGIYSGIFTPTESAIVACVYGLIISLFVYREIKITELFEVFAASALTSGTVLVLVGCATAFGRVLTILGIPQMVAETILSVTTNKFLILLIINIILFITGMFMETLAAVVILAPLLLQIVLPLGVDPIHFGIMMTMNLVIGQCTPPVGVNIFVSSRLAGIKLDDTIATLLPMIGVLIIALLLVTYIPQISLLLPNILVK